MSLSARAGMRNSRRVARLKGLRRQEAETGSAGLWGVLTSPPQALQSG